MTPTTAPERNAGTPTGQEPGLASLATGILHDVQTLFEQQLRLFKHELEVKFQKTKEASTMLGMGVMLALLGGLMLCFGLAYLLNWAFPPLAPWGGGFFIMAAVALFPGAILAAIGIQQLESVNPVPEQSAETLKENLEWTRNPS
jgi:uncharacterized membrane protein YqjE